MDDEQVLVDRPRREPSLPHHVLAIRLDHLWRDVTERDRAEHRDQDAVDDPPVVAHCARSSPAILLDVA